MEAETIAKPPNIAAKNAFSSFKKTAVVIKAPVIIIPDSAFIPLINGVCNKEGTLLINKYTTKPFKIQALTVG